jgi:Asp-tRNA(Asn)/Glu-tRNA(Gln) amidotransferase A subunit family amidase
VLIKDNIDVAGPADHGRGAWRLEHWMPAEDAPIVAALRAAGRSSSARRTCPSWRTS